MACTGTTFNFNFYLSKVTLKIGRLTNKTLVK